MNLEIPNPKDLEKTVEVRHWYPLLDYQSTPFKEWLMNIRTSVNMILLGQWVDRLVNMHAQRQTNRQTSSRALLFHMHINNGQFQGIAFLAILIPSRTRDPILRPVFSPRTLYI